MLNSGLRRLSLETTTSYETVDTWKMLDIYSNENAFHKDVPDNLDTAIRKDAKLRDKIAAYCAQKKLVQEQSSSDCTYTESPNTLTRDLNRTRRLSEEINSYVQEHYKVNLV